MFKIDRWRVTYDVDNRVGYIEFLPAGAPPAATPTRTAALPAEDFAAFCAVLNAARAAGGTPTWDPATCCIFF